MAISETGSVQAEKLAIEQINDMGGILGRKIEIIQEDGASDWPTFAEKSRKLLVQDRVATVFGCWTSASRKAVLPVFEKENGLLYYPTFYEGLEQSKNVIYTGQEATQQILAGLDWIAKEKERQDLLSDRVGLHLAAHLDEDRAQAHRKRPQGHGGGRGILPARTHPLRLGHQQDEAQEAGRDLQRGGRRQQRGLVQAAQGGRRDGGEADPAHHFGHRG
ncbi:MAG: transporter substrate-binding protein [Candidatus Manganitrophus sp.]|nr:transporter substrate-binding protein [Candidatus Manganitrophus sp.]